MKKISIVVPVYQNELSLRDSINSLTDLNCRFGDLGYSLEIILIDDGSTDKSYQILKEYINHKNIIIVKLTRNFGQIPAIQAGLRYASGKYVGIISADLQDPPELFFSMLDYLEQDNKLVVAERTDREEGFFHRFTSSLYWGLIKKFSMKDFPSGGFDFCMFDQQIVQELNNIYEKNTNIFPLVFWLGFKPVILPYKRTNRVSGKSSWTFFKKIKLAVDTVIGFTYLPTRFISITAIFISLLAFFYSIYTLIIVLTGHGAPPDGWTTLAIMILIIGGMILFALGIIGEYVLRILDETRKRPNYIIDEVHTNIHGKT